MNADVTVGNLCTGAVATTGTDGDDDAEATAVTNDTGAGITVDRGRRLCSLTGGEHRVSSLSSSSNSKPDANRDRVRDCASCSANMVPLYDVDDDDTGTGANAYGGTDDRFSSDSFLDGTGGTGVHPRVREDGATTGTADNDEDEVTVAASDDTETADCGTAGTEAGARD